MEESILILTGKNGTSLEKLLETANIMPESASRIRILLFGDGVLAATTGSNESKSLRRLSRMEFFACSEDLQSRGLLQKLDPIVKALSYDEIVDMLLMDDSKIVNYV